MVAFKNQIQYFKEQIDFYNLWDDPRVISLFKLLFINPTDYTASNHLEQILRTHPKVLSKQLGENPFPTPTPGQLSSGDIRIGKDDQGNPYYINIEALFKHLLNSAATGYCKTSLFKILQTALHEYGIKWLAADFKKDCQELLPAIPQVNLFISEDPNFRWNPLTRIPSMTANEQDTLFSQVLSETCFMQEGGYSFVMEHLANLRKELPYPTVIDLYNSIDTRKCKTQRVLGWRDTAHRSVQGLVQKFGKLLFCKKGIDIIHLIENNNVSLELDKAGAYRGFWPTLILAYYVMNKIWKNQKDEKASRHVNFFDEGNFLFSKLIQKHSVAKIPTLLGIVQLCRQFREGFVISTNNPANLCDEVKVNTSTKIASYLGDDKDISCMSSAMSLTYEQKMHIPLLRQGDEIIKKEGQPTHKIILDYPKIKKGNLSESEIRKLSERKISRYHIIRAEPTGIPQKTSEPKIDQSEILFLKDIAHNVTHTKTRHYKNCGFSMDKGNRIFNKVLSKNLVQELTINLGGNKHQAKILFLTEKGYAAVNLSPSYNQTRGDGQEHLFWTTLYTKQLHQSGFKAKESYSLNGKETDIAIIDNSKVTAIEISVTTTAEHEADQIQKNFKAGYGRVITFASKDKVEKIKKLIPNGQTKVLIFPFVPNINEVVSQIPERSG